MVLSLFIFFGRGVLKFKGLLKNKGFLAGIFVSFLLLFYFISFSGIPIQGIPFNIIETSFCNSMVTSISNIDYQINDADWGSVWVANIQTGIGCDTIIGGSFADGTNVGSEDFKIETSLDRQGCRGVIETGTGGALGGEYLRELKILAVVDKFGVGNYQSLHLAGEVETEKACFDVLTSQGNDYYVSKHTWTPEFGLFGLPLLTSSLQTDCYGFKESDLNLLGSVTSYNKFYNISMRLLGTHDSGILTFDEGKSINRFSTGIATITSPSSGVQDCNDPLLANGTPVLTPGTIFFGGGWKLISSDRVDAVEIPLDNVQEANNSDDATTNSVSTVESYINTYNSSVDMALSSYLDLTFSNQAPEGLLGNETSFEVIKTDVVRPMINLRLSSDWVGLKVSEGIPKIISINALDGLASRNIPVSVVVKNIDPNNAGSFFIQNHCALSVAPTEITRGVDGGDTTTAVFYNNSGTIGDKICNIYVIDSLGNNWDEEQYSFNVSPVCKLVDDGNWVVNQDTCSLQCGLTGCERGFTFDAYNCICVPEDDGVGGTQDCSLIAGSSWNVLLNRCVCPTGEESTLIAPGLVSCEPTKLEVCGEGFKLNEAGDRCIPKELNLLAVFGAILIVGGIVFIGWNLFFGNKRKGNNFSRIVRG